jgi:hypothetical protein
MPPRTEESKALQRAKMLGRPGHPLTPQGRETLRLKMSGTRNPQCGVPITEERKQKQRIKMLGQRNPWFGKREESSGDKNPNWHGGVSLLPWPIEFNEELKERIRDRDNHVCQMCGLPESECFQKLDVHHVDYNKQNCDPSNLISLCDRCHSKTNHNRKYWAEYLKNLLFSRIIKI